MAHTAQAHTKEDAVLVFDGVHKSYDLGKRKLEVLKGVSFRVNRGNFISIMGPSGSGKSTLLHMIGCLDQPTVGKVFVDGQEVSTLNSDRLAEVRGQKIGFVFQAFNLLPNLTALQNVEVAMAIDDVPKAERVKRARELLARVGLSHREDHKPNELSGGEKQRVAIARALANNPSFLLADEPTGNLDSKSGEEVMGMITDLWKQHKATIVMVTHEPEVAGYSQRIIRLRDGTIEKEVLVDHSRHGKRDLKHK